MTENAVANAIEAPQSEVEIFTFVFHNSLPILFQDAIRMRILEEKIWKKIAAELKINAPIILQIWKAMKELKLDLQKYGIGNVDLYDLLNRTDPADGEVDY